MPSSIHQMRFADVQTPMCFQESVKKMAIVLDIIAQLRKLRTQEQLSLNMPLHSLSIAIAGLRNLEMFQEHQLVQMIKGITKASNLYFVEVNTMEDDVVSSIEPNTLGWHAVVVVNQMDEK